MIRNIININANAQAQGGSEDEESQEESQYELEKESIVFLIAKVNAANMVVLSPSEIANLAAINNQLEETNFLYIIEDAEATQKITWINDLGLLILQEPSDSDFFLRKLMEVKRDQSVIDTLQILMHEKMQPPPESPMPFAVNEQAAPENIAETEQKPPGGILARLAQN